MSRGLSSRARVTENSTRHFRIWRAPMGREAICECTFADTTAEVKGLLESDELILRGNIRMRAPLHALHDVRVESESLCFHFDKHPVQLRLGAAAAKSWAKKINTPPPPLSQTNLESPARPCEPSAPYPTRRLILPSTQPHKSPRVTLTSSSLTLILPNPLPPRCEKQRHSSPDPFPSGSCTARAPDTRSTNPPSAPVSVPKVSWTRK